MASRSIFDLFKEVWGGVPASAPGPGKPSPGLMTPQPPQSAPSNIPQTTSLSNVPNQGTQQQAPQRNAPIPEHLRGTMWENIIQQQRSPFAAAFDPNGNAPRAIDHMGNPLLNAQGTGMRDDVRSQAHQFRGLLGFSGR